MSVPTTLIENVHYYIDENDNFVFTSLYHTERGYCCKNGCKHCPYSYVSPKNKDKSTKAVAARVSKLIGLFLFFLSTQLSAQENYYTQSNIVNTFLQSTASACLSSKLEVGMGFKNDDGGIANQRQTQFVYAAFDVERMRSVFGVQFINHSAQTFFPIKYQTLGLSHSFKLHPNDHSVVAIGMQCMLHHIVNTIDEWPVLQQPSIFEPVEPLYRLPYIKSDWNFSVAYTNKEWRFHGAVLHPGNPTWLVGGGYPSYRMEREIYVSALYTLKKYKEQIWVRPSLQAHTKLQATLLNAMLHLGWRGWFFVGAGGNLFDRRLVNYPYDYTLQLTGHVADRFNIAIIYSHINGNFVNQPNVGSSFRANPAVEMHLNYAF